MPQRVRWTQGGTRTQSVRSHLRAKIRPEPPASQAATYHVLHADADLAVAVERPVEAHDVRGVALMENLQLPYDLVPDGRFDLQVN